MERFSMISITIDVTIFDLSEYYNVKMHNFKFFGNGEHPYILWSVNDHEIPNTLDYRQSSKITDILINSVNITAPTYYRYPNSRYSNLPLRSIPLT
jgi:hypothetical protein